MSGERPDVADRLDAAAIAIASLNALLVADGSLDDVLHGVALNAVRAVAGADAVSITVVDPPLLTVAHTDEDILALDQEQYASRQGPCLEAAETRRPVRVAMEAEEQRWPQFVSAARAAGVRATLSIPLIIASPLPGGDDELVGSLNAYSRSTASFDVVDEKIMRLYTDVAGQAVTDARRWQRLRDTVQQLEAALVSRADIDQAKGVLRTRHGGTADEAFARLVERSQRENVKIRDIARRILEGLPRSTATKSRQEDTKGVRDASEDAGRRPRR
jgi:ANTAR domain/GAF domain